MSDQRTTRFHGMKNPHLTAALLLTIFAAGVLFVWWMAAQADREMRSELLRQTRLVAQPVNVQRVISLLGTEADMDSPGYRRIKEQLAAVRLANSQYRFLYIMGRRSDGTIFFFADSELAGSEDYLPPGQVYEEIPEGYRRVFDAKAAAVEGPVTDRWGVWVSALVPLTDPQTGAVVAVLGIDIDAHEWKWEVAVRAALPVGLMFLLLIGVAFAIVSASGVDASPKPVLRMLPFMAVIVVLLIVGAGAILWKQHQQQLTGEITANISKVSSDLHMVLDQQAFGLSMAAQPIAANANVQKALYEGDSDRLMADWQPVFEMLRWQYKLTHFYFFDINRVCLLRIHNPEKRGDVINRFTAIEAERTGKTASGIELGPLGTFTLRVVQPVFEGGRLVGYVELGKEIEDILQTIDAQSGNQLAVVIGKEHLDRQTWEDGMRLLRRLPDWDRLSHNVVIYASHGRLPDVFAPWADQTAGKQGGDETSREIAFDGKDWRVSATPLQDVSGKGVGDLLIMCDITTVNIDFARLMVLGGTGAAMLLALLVGFIYVLLRRTDAGIRAQQAALRESEESYRNQFANNSVVMLLIDPADGAIIDANVAALRFYGYQLEQLLTMCIADINTMSASEVRQVMASVPQGEGTRFEFQHRLADGSLRNVEASSSSIHFGGRIVLHSIIHDITERKRVEAELQDAKMDLEKSRDELENKVKERTAELEIEITERTQAVEALRESERRFREVLENVQMVALTLDGDGNITFCNNFLLSLTGWSREEIIGNNWYDIFIPADDDLKVKRIFAKAMATASLPSHHENMIKTRSGSLRLIVWDNILLKDTVGTAAGSASIGIDVTDHRNAEAQLLQAQKMESVGRLAGGVAHDFNNMLTAIMGHAELAMMKCTSSAPIIAHLKVIEDTAHRSADLTRQLLAFARKQTIAPKVLDINGTVSGMLKMLQRLIGEDLDLVWMPGADLWQVKIDPSQIDQILVNLCVNARDAIPGVGKINIETENIAMDEAYCAFHPGFVCGEYVMLVVSDNGHGMSKEVLDHIFEPFFTTKEVGKGTGLGLATVYGIVKQNEGIIDVYSESDKGTTFKIYLPRFVGKAMEPTVEIAAEMPRGSGETVLLVEDEAPILDVSKEILEQLGYVVLIASTPGEALRLAKTHVADIHLMITDVIMPVMNGRDLSKLISNIKPGIKCLFISGYTANVIAHQGVLDEGVNFIQKPFSMKGLAFKVREVLDNANG